MYPFATWAWEELWAAVHERAPWTPATLTWSGDVHARWYDTACLVTHVCGWPYAALHHSDMHLVGAFALTIDEADDAGHYRSVLLSPHRTDLDELVARRAHAVANSADSLSGWHSLIAAGVGPGGDWPGRVTFTSAHGDSVRALARGDADVACIDSWTLALLSAEEPDLVAGLHRVGLGPLIPTPAITARKSVPVAAVDQLRRAFLAVTAEPTLRPALTTLRIGGFVEHGDDAYEATLRLSGD